MGIELPPKTHVLNAESPFKTHVLGQLESKLHITFNRGLARVRHKEELIPTDWIKSRDNSITIDDINIYNDICGASGIKVLEEGLWGIYFNINLQKKGSAITENWSVRLNPYLQSGFQSKYGRRYTLHKRQSVNSQNYSFRRY